MYIQKIKALCTSTRHRQARRMKGPTHHLPALCVGANSPATSSGCLCIELEPQAGETPALLSSIFGENPHALSGISSHHREKTCWSQRATSLGSAPASGKTGGLGRCWSHVPACLGSVSREKALESSGSSYLHGTIGGKKQFGAHEVTLAAQRGQQPVGIWWSQGVPDVQQLQQLPMVLPRCPSSQPANPPAKAALGQEAAPQAAAHLG